MLEVLFEIPGLAQAVWALWANSKFQGGVFRKFLRGGAQRFLGRGYIFGRFTDRTLPRKISQISLTKMFSAKFFCPGNLCIFKKGSFSAPSAKGGGGLLGGAYTSGLNKRTGPNKRTGH